MSEHLEVEQWLQMLRAGVISHTAFEALMRARATHMSNQAGLEADEKDVGSTFRGFRPGPAPSSTFYDWSANPGASFSSGQQDDIPPKYQRMPNFTYTPPGPSQPYYIGYDPDPRGRFGHVVPPPAPRPPSPREKLLDYWEIPRDADAARIKSRYREIAKVAHPDLGGDEEAMKQLNRQYEYLGAS